jgi:hypothetical protein
VTLAELCSHSRDYGAERFANEKFCILGYNGVQPVEIQPTFRTNKPPSVVKQRLCLLVRRISQANSSTLKIEENCCSETSVDFQRTTGRYVSEFPPRRPGFASWQHVGFVEDKAALW